MSSLKTCSGLRITFLNRVFHLAGLITLLLHRLALLILLHLAYEVAEHLLSLLNLG
jgi:hypothetical protein|tara:strand:+ start:296 stop:463 length:168 start_codon:yes stop_codon:yes gene_type:complete